MKPIEKTLLDWYSLLTGGEDGALRSIFFNEPVINTPLKSEIKGRDEFSRYVQEEREWLNEHRAKVKPIAHIVTDNRIVAEIVLYLHSKDKIIDLPISMAADLVDGSVSGLRVYHSTWPLTGEHLIRHPFLAPKSDLKEPDTVKKYMTGLGIGDWKSVLALFDDEGYIREPSGSEYRHSGKKGLRAFYETALSDGGIHLEHCTAAFDGKLFAVEYNCDKWGKVEIPAQAGMAVYELTDTGKLLSARIYDDVSPPGETG